MAGLWSADVPYPARPGAVQAAPGIPVPGGPGRTGAAATSARRAAMSRNAITSAMARHSTATTESVSNWLLPRGVTGTAGMAAVPPPNWAVAARPCPVPRYRASRPAILSAAAASTVPYPTSWSYPPCGLFEVLAVIACATRDGASVGCTDLISAATPAVNAQAGLVPLTSQYWPSLPCAGTRTPGAATWTERLSLENPAGMPSCATAPTPSTPG